MTYDLLLIFAEYHLCCVVQVRLALVALSMVGPVARSFARPQFLPDSKSSGDAPDDPGPLATDLSAEMKPKAIQAAIKKVGDWQVKVAEPRFNRLWTYAALYDGLIAASKATAIRRISDAVLKFSEQEKWLLIESRFPHADDQALGKAYMDLYLADAKNARSRCAWRTRRRIWTGSSFVRTILRSCSGGGAMRFTWRRRCFRACTLPPATRSIWTTWITSGG